MALSQAELAALYEEDEPKKTLSQDELAALFDAPEESGNPLVKGAYNLLLKPVIDRAKAYQNPEMDLSEKIASDPAYRMFYGGVVEPVIGASQFLNRKVVQPLTGYSGGSRALDALTNRNQEIEQSGRQKMGEEDPTGFDPYKLAGGMMVPLGVGAKANVAKTLLERIGIGAGIGGVSAATMPVYGEENQANYDVKKGEQVAAGMAIGAGIPAVTTAGSKIFGALKNQADQLIRPFSEKGIKRDVRDLLIEQLGPERTRVIEAMMLADKDMTAGQALAKYAQETGNIAGAPVMRLESELSKKGGTGIPLRETYGKQQSARESIINRLAGTEDDISHQPLGATFKDQAGGGDVGELSDDMPAMLRQQGGGLPIHDAEMIADPLQRAKTIRSIKANELYDKAWSVPLVPDKEFTKISGNPYFRQMMPSIDRLNEVEGITPQTNLTKYLHNAKLALDGALEKQGESALSRAEKGKVSELKKEIVDYLGSRNKFYEEARNAFQEESVPINQMEVGRYLNEKLSSPTGDEAPGTFLRAAKDAPKTLKSSTGFSRYNELGDVLNPEQVGDVNKVVAALERQAIAKKSTGQVETMLPKLEGGIEISIPNMLSRPAMVANAVLRGIGKNKAPEYNRIATEIVKNPQKLAELLQDTGQTGQIAKQIYQDILPFMAGQTTGREIGE